MKKVILAVLLAVTAMSSAATAGTIKISHTGWFVADTPIVKLQYAGSGPSFEIPIGSGDFLIGQKRSINIDHNLISQHASPSGTPHIYPLESITITSNLDHNEKMVTVDFDLVDRLYVIEDQNFKITGTTFKQNFYPE